MTRASTLRRLSAAGAWVFITLVLQEIALRSVFPLPELRGFNRINYMPQGAIPKNARAIRSVRVLSRSAPDSAGFTADLNLYGFRDETWALTRPAGTTRVMFVGDSFVEGIMVEAADTIPRLFEGLARNAGMAAQAMNLGVAAADTDDYVRLVADASPPFQPDWVVVVLFANDLPAETRQNPGGAIEPWHSRSPRLLDLVGMLRDREMLPFRWSIRTISYTQPVPNPINPFSDPKYEKRMEGLVSPRMIKFMKAGEFNPYRVGSSWWYESSLREAFDYRRDLSRIAGSLALGHSRLLVAYVPERRQVSNYYRRFEAEYSSDDFDMTQPAYQLRQKLLAEQCAALGIPFLDLTPAIAEQERRGNHLYWDYDDHLRPAGNRVAAGALFGKWLSLQGT